MEYIEDDTKNSTQRTVLLWSAFWLNILVCAFFYLHETRTINFVRFQDDCQEVYAAIGGFSLSLIPMVWAIALRHARINPVHWIAAGMYIPIALLESMICFFGLAFCDFNLAAFG